MRASTVPVFAILTTLALVACSNDNGGHPDRGVKAADEPKIELQIASAQASASVDLSAADNVFGIANSGAAAIDGGLDGLGNAYAGALLGTSRAWSGATFTIAAPGGLDAVSSKTIALPAGSYSKMLLLATAVNGNQSNQSFIVTYSDGSNSTFTQSLSDWYTPQGFAGESQALQMSYRITASGALDSRNFYLYGYSFTLDSTKSVASLTLPSNRNVVVLAAYLSAALPAAATPAFNPAPGTYSSAQMVALSDTTPGAAIHYTTDGTTPTASSAVYRAPLQVASTTTLKAIAVAGGYDNSAVSTGTYVITGSSGVAVSVNLLTADNVYGIANSGAAAIGGGLDGLGNAYAGALLGTALAWSGATFTIGAAGGLDAVSSKTIALPAGSYSKMLLLASAMNGNQSDQSFVVTYTDGSKSTFTQSLSDWYTPQGFGGESQALQMPYRITASGALDNRTFYLYGYSFTLDSTKSVASLTLPNNRNVVVLGADLISGASGSVNLSAADNLYGIANSGAPVVGGGLDGLGNAYAGTLLGSSLAWSGATFTIGAAGGLDAVSGKTIFLPAGNYSKMLLLATAVNGNQSSQSFIVTYSDGSNSTFTQSLSDWYSPQGFGGESQALQMPYRITASGTLDNRTFYLYGYSFTLDSAKTVASLTLPNNRNVVVLAIDLIPANPVSNAVSPNIAALTLSQSQQFAATLSGGGGVSWAVDGISGGNSSVGLISSTGLYTPGTATGAHQIVATSTANSAQTATAAVYVTDLTGVLTYHNDLGRQGANSQEYALVPSRVSTGSFGKLFSCHVDGAVYAQPLWAAGLLVNGAYHNVVFVATAHDSLYAFDADTSPCLPLWSISLIDTQHGANAGESSVPSGTSGFLVGSGDGDMTPEVGVVGTPVIDSGAHILYVVSKSVSSDHSTFYQRLHALDLLTGREQAGSPVAISATYPGSGDGGAVTTFSPRQQNQRSGLALVNGTVYVAWASHEDTAPYYGWVMGYRYNGSSFSRSAVLNVTPNVHYGGIWMGGAAPSSDGSYLYLLTGNGGFDANSASAPNNDYGDSLLRLNGGNLSVSEYFTPSDQAADNSGDQDFGSGGTAVLADLSTLHLIVGGGKDGNLYVLNRDSLGGFGDSVALQKIGTGHGMYMTGAYWNYYYYTAGMGGPLQAYQLTMPAVPDFTPAGASPNSFGFPGATPSVSSSGTQSGIVWALDNHNYCTNQSNGCGPAVLHAYDATNVAHELWNSSIVAGDAAGNAVKFTVPTVANGHVYVGTRGNNTGGVYGSTSISGELEVYGLKSN
jgi:hypothetical protein